MPSPASADLDIINEIGFGEEPDQRHPARETDAPHIRQRTQHADAFEALESGLEVDPNAPDVWAGEAQEPDADPYDVEEPVAARAEPRIPLRFAAFVVVACAGLGAATATLVLHDRVMQITSSWTAGR